MRFLNCTQWEVEGLCRALDQADQALEGAAALMMASARGHAQVVELLIAAGAKLDLRTRNGDTALRWASFWGHAEIAGQLRVAGAA